MSKETRSAGSDTLHNPDNVLRLGMGSLVTSWIILAIYAFQFIYNLVNAFQSGFTLGANMDTLLGLIQLITPMTIGLFFFLTLQGIAQGLYIGLDLYMGTEEPEEAA
jgi:hypothetical protein